MFAIIASKGETFRKWSGSQDYLINTLHNYQAAEHGTYFTTIPVSQYDYHQWLAGIITPSVQADVDSAFFDIVVSR